MPVPVGMVLDVTEPLSAQITSAEPPVLDRALAVIPAESRALSSAPPVPEIRQAVIPELPLKMPDQEEVWVPVMPEVGGGASSVLVSSPLGQTSGVTSVTTAAVRAKFDSGTGQGTGGRPIALAEILPHYPYGARARGEAGWVTVRVRVSDQGTVESATVVSGSGHSALDDSAVAATTKARFKPAEQEGKPVPSDMNLQFEFRLEER